MAVGAGDPQSIRTPHSAIREVMTVRTVVTTSLPAAWNAAKSCSPSSIRAAAPIASRSSEPGTCHAYRRSNGLATSLLSIR